MIRFALTLSLFLCVSLKSVVGQTNKFPDEGNVGIGTTAPATTLDVNITGSSFMLRRTSLQVNQWQFLIGGSVESGVRNSGSLSIFNTHSSDFNVNASGDGQPFTSQFIIKGATGKVGIGTSNPSEKLSVNGNIRAKEIKVEVSNWPDYVFNESYRSRTLKELERFITEHKHLPGLPSQQKAEAEGIELGEMNKQLLVKIEELTLYLIDQGKEIEALKNSNEQLKKEIGAVQNSLQTDQILAEP